MARIKTKAALVEYMQRQMGAPSIKVELTEDQFNDCIDKAIERYSEYAFDGTIESTLLVQLEEGVFDYTLPDNVIAVTGLQASSVYSTFINIPAGYTLAMNPITLTQMDNVSNIDVQTMTERMAKMSTLRSFFDIEPNWRFNHNTKVLSFFEQPASSVMVLEISSDYEPQEIDNIYNNQWIKKRAIGEAFHLWSTVTGKYSSSLVNGTSINYGDLEAKGNAMIAESEEELFEIGEPLGAWVF
jgi:hypothetical protein